MGAFPDCSEQAENFCMRMTFHLRERPAAVPYVKYIAALLLFGSNGIVASRIHLESSEIILLRPLHLQYASLHYENPG